MSEYEEILFRGTTNSNEESEVDIESQYMVVVDEIERCRKINKVLKEKLSKYQEETNSIITYLRNQLQEAKKSEEYLVVFLRKRIQDSGKIEKEITQLREGFYEKSFKSKFENNSRILDGILNSQRSSSDRFGLAFIKEKNPEIFPFTNKRRSTKSYAETLKSPVKKEK